VAPVDLAEVRRQPSIDPLRRKCAAKLNRQSSYPFDFRLTSLAGRTIRKGQFAGRLLIVDIWATWCGPCVREVPHFIDLQDRYHEHGLSIVGINFEREANDRESLRKVDSFARDIGINYPLALGNDSITDQIEDFRGYPTTLFIDGNGQVRLTLRGSRPLAELETFVQLLDDPSIRGKSPSQASAPATAPTIQPNPLFAKDQWVAGGSDFDNSTGSS
jgi:thiol-disulfide isomerase/thioredoxin